MSMPEEQHGISELLCVSNVVDDISPSAAASLRRAKHRIRKRRDAGAAH